MPEEPKNIRLNKAAKELNVGIPTLVEYLNHLLRFSSSRDSR